MKRIVGFALLQAAAVLFAYGRVTDRERENNALRSFSDMLDQLRGLLESDASPMPELLRKLSKCSVGEARYFVDSLNASMNSLGECSFQELWHRALSEQAALPGEQARQELEALGALLGRYDLQSQLDAAAECREKLRQSLEKRQNDHRQDMYLTIGLSLSASLLLGILLI